LKFYDTDDDSLLFSVVETGGRGTEVFSNYWAFYKLIDGKMRRALLALRSGYHEGWGMLFKREYESEAWPYFYSKPDIGFTYYIKYSGDSVYYNSRFKGAPRFLEAFTLRKNVVFQWDDRTKQYLIDAKRSQLSAGQIQAIFDDGEKEFYAKYKWRIKFLQFFGSERQKEWARVFERVVTGKSETVWVESAGEYIEVAKDIKSPKVAALSIQDSIDALRYYNLKIDETEVGMSYFFGWQPDDKKAMKMAAEEAIAKLDDISKSLENLNLPKELIRARDYHFLVIKGLKKIYEGSEKKSSDQIAKEFDELGKTASEKHAKDVGPVFEELLKSERLAQDYDVLSEEIRYAETNEDKENYRSAVKLIDEKKYKEAYDKLSALREKYKGKVFENCVMLRISDCLLLDDSDLGTVMDGEKVLSEVVSSKTYHPVIFESFEKWRSVYQSNNHGMSNYSVIPNDEYNKKRWDAVKVIKDYLKKNPADRWAREQVNALLESPNISRGITFGNWNLMYYAWFYSPDVFPKDRKNGYRLNQLRFSGDDQKDKESADTTSATKK
jgi:TolA-binding protein